MAAYTTIDDASLFFSPTLYTGNGTAVGSGGLAVTGVGFQPDFTWIKNRDAVDFHVLTDAVRGVTKYLNSNSTNVEATDINSLTSFDSDGFTVGDMAEVNTNTEDYVSWNWKAGTTTGINLDSATLTPTGYSFNQTSSFSVIAWRGVVATAPNTIPHGLGVKPDMIIIKNITSPDGYIVYHTSLGATKYMVMNNTTAVVTSSDYWNDTEPTTTKFTTNVSGAVAGGSTEDLIAYCFASVKGYSKFGSYTGNGDADGQFINLGFRPAYVMIKRTSGESWTIIDDQRLGYNEANYQLFANATSIDTTEMRADILSNGFKAITTNGEWNANGGTYIYMAFANSPLANSNGVPCNAR